MIVRDEAALLPGCLASVAGAVDEIVVVDTGSSDSTVEIARAAGATVVSEPWRDDFAAARNAGLQRVTGDWVLLLDADERLAPGAGPALRAAIAQADADGLRLRIASPTGEGTGGAIVALVLRAWRHGPHVRFRGRVHEQLAGLKTPMAAMPAPDGVEVLHLGYRDDVVAAAGKRDRNLRLLERELAQRGEPDAFLLFNLGSEHLARGEPERAVDPLQRALTALAGRTPSAVPYGPPLVLRLAGALREAGRASDGEALAAEHLATLADFTDLAVERALCAAAAGDPERALGLLDAALSGGDGPAAYGSRPGLAGPIGAAVRARLRLAAGHPPAAVAEEAGPAVAGHAGAAVEVAEALLERGAADEAAALAALAVTADPQARPARRAASHAAALGALLDSDGAAADAALADAVGLGLPAAAAQALRAWTAATQGTSPPRTSVPAAEPLLTGLRAAIAAGRPDAAEAAYRALRASELPEADARNRAARAFMDGGYPDIACDEWMAVLDLRPDPDALVGLARVALERRQLPEARDLAAAALALDPEATAAARLIRRLDGLLG
jgi:tetratricopeptide (TPR) repeat protein